MSNPVKRVEAALADLRAGKMIILTDDAARENEGDLICAAEKITPAQMNLMIRAGSGIVCLTLTSEKAAALQLDFMVPPHKNSSQRGTPFTVTIEAASGVTTGVSAADRVATIHAAIALDAKPADLARPGHVFPLIAVEGGVLMRAGHTEGSVDLMRLAGLQPAAVLCEVMNEDGSMAYGDALDAFAKTHAVRTLAMADLIEYRLSQENLIESEVSATLPTKALGEFDITIVREKYSGLEHVVLLAKKTKKITQPLLVRIHSACMTGDLFGSARCDCQQQLHYAMQKIHAEGGMLIYLAQEGRGIGLFEKIRAYALQEKGMDTVAANEHLNLPVDARQYHIAANILKSRGVTRVKLLTRNPAKIADLHKYGITEVVREEIPVFAHAGNREYLLTKKQRLKHMIDDSQL